MNGDSDGGKMLKLKTDEIILNILHEAHLHPGDDLKKKSCDDNTVVTVHIEY